MYNVVVDNSNNYSGIGAVDKSVELRVFCSENLSGSPQLLHIFPELTQMHAAFASYTVADQYDHSFIYFAAPERALVKWKNSAGPIQFCGSAAYGLAWLALSFLRKNNKENSLRILADSLEIDSRFDADGIVMTFPAREVQRITAQPIRISNGESLFTNTDSGTFLLETAEPIESKDLQWLWSYVAEQQLTDVHGFCVFCWDRGGASGKLRYFVPWHGRNEDSVTGSIHRYLTPLVHTLYGVENQVWTQISSSGGTLTSHYAGGEVSLVGHCRIHTAS